MKESKNLNPNTNACKNQTGEREAGLLTLTPWILILTHQQHTSFENVGKEETAHNKQFLLFPQCFLLNQKIVSPFLNMFDIISLIAVELEEPKIGI